jgi:hypothetical protein
MQNRWVAQIAKLFIAVISQKTPADDVIIVIARLGAVRNKPSLNWRRLHMLGCFDGILEKSGRRKTETLILGRRERVEATGILIFMWAVNWLVLLKCQNADLPIGSCYPPYESYIRDGIFIHVGKKRQDFYPCRDRYSKRRRKR